MFLYGQTYLQNTILKGLRTLFHRVGTAKILSLDSKKQYTRVNYKHKTNYIQDTIF